jgi:quercetin dioxygenase-like cupin family protein
VDLQLKNWKNSGTWFSMANSEALGLPLVGAGSFGADMLRFAPRQSTLRHTHPGDHVLFVVEGDGSLCYGDELHKLLEGDCYYVPGAVPHSICAAALGLVLLSVANQHRPVASPERSEVVR